MDTKTLAVGQKVAVFGCGFFEGTVVSITPDGVGVESDDGFAQFDKDGKETEDSRYRRVGGSASMLPEWQPWELRSLDEVNFERNVTSWLLEFFKSGEKPAEEIFKEAERKFGKAGDQVRRAFDTLGLTKRQENHRWYWSLRWELDENNRVVGLAPNHGSKRATLSINSFLIRQPVFVISEPACCSPQKNEPEFSQQRCSP